MITHGSAKQLLMKSCKLPNYNMKTFEIWKDKLNKKNMQTWHSVKNTFTEVKWCKENCD